jgi:hypothetical protein
METNWNKYFTKFIEKYNDKHWNWHELSSNPNITWDIIEANLDKYMSWSYLSRNKFAKEKEIFELRVKHQKFVQKHLFEEFVKAYMHPNRIKKLLDMGYKIDELDDIL